MTENRQTIVENPVGTVRELLVRGASKPSGRATDRKVEEFLAAEPATADVAEAHVETNVERIDNSFTNQSPRQATTQVEGKDKTRAGKERKSNRPKPIFQQS